MDSRAGKPLERKEMRRMIIAMLIIVGLVVCSIVFGRLSVLSSSNEQVESQTVIPCNDGDESDPESEGPIDYLIDNGFLAGKTLVYDSIAESYSSLVDMIRRIVDHLNGKALCVEEWIEEVLSLEADDSTKREYLHSNDLNLMMKSEGDSYDFSLSDSMGTTIRAVSTREQSDDTVRITWFARDSEGQPQIETTSVSGAEINDLMITISVFLLTGER